VAEELGRTLPGVGMVRDAGIVCADALKQKRMIASRVVENR
jgi:hypothetical protein